MGFKSKFEITIADSLRKNHIKFEYETLKIPYVKPESHHTYLPDFVLPNGIIIEGKGLFDENSRNKMRLVKEQHPELDIRFVFMRSSNKIRKGSPTTYADWSRKHGFPFADKSIPNEWLLEAAFPKQKGQK